MKSKIRVRIEEILNVPAILEQERKEKGHAYMLVYLDNRAKGQYRIKFVGVCASDEQLAEIKALPHVVHAYSWFNKTAIYFDCRPKSIEL